MVTRSRAILIATAQRRLIEARRLLDVVHGRVPAGDRDDREQEQVALQEVNRARAELAALQTKGGGALRQTGTVTA